MEPRSNGADNRLSTTAVGGPRKNGMMFYCLSNILSAIFDPYQWFIRNLNLISSIIGIVEPYK